MNNIEANTEALFDLSMLEEMEDDEYLLEMIDIFLSEAPKELKEMNQALQANKSTIVSQKAHKLKSNAGIIQANQLMETLDKIEFIGKRTVNNQELVPLVKSAVQQYQNIEAGLKVYVKVKKLR